MSTRWIRCLRVVLLFLPAGAFAQPDLKLEGLSVYSTTVQRDGNRLVSVSVRVVNTGPGAAAASVTRVEINQSGVDLQTPRLQPQQTAYLSHFLRTTSSSAKIVVNADAQQQVAEGNEINNGLQSVVDTVGVENGRWQFLGPSVVRNTNGVAVGVGRVTTLAIDPRTADTVYVGARGTGVWKTTNGGGTWAPLTDALPLTTVAAIAIEPVHPNRVLMASPAGVFESRDGGSVWIQLTNRDLHPIGHDGAAFLVQSVPEPVIALAAPGAVVAPAAIRPEPALYLSSTDGLYVSTDRGRTWNLVLDGASIGSLQFSTGTPSILFASLNGPSDKRGIYIGDNGGLTPSSWHKLQGCPTAPLPPIPASSRVWVAASGVRRWMSFLAGGADGRVRQLWKTRSRACTVNGLSEFEWVQVPISPSCDKEPKDNSSFLFLHPKNSSIVFKAGLPLCRDGFGSSPALTPEPRPHVDQHAIAVAPSQPSTMYLGNDGGLYRSDDTGVTWRFVSEGLGIAEFLDGSITANAAGIVGGSWDNGASSGTSTSPSWREVAGGDVTSVAFDRSAPSTIFTVAQGIHNNIVRVGGGPAKNLSDDSVLPVCTTGTEDGPSITGQIVSTGDSSPLVIACAGLWGGPPWHSIAAGTSSGFVRVRLAPGNFWIAGTNDGRVFGGLNIFAPSLMMTASPAASISGLGFGGAGTFYASTRSTAAARGRIFRITCTGTTCGSEDIGLNLPTGEIMTIAGDPLAPDAVLAALRDNGIFRGTRTGANWTWESYSNGLPGGVTVTDMETASNGQIVVTTWGRGAFRLHSGPPRDGTQTARGRVRDFEEERVDPDRPVGPSNPLVVTVTLDSQPDTVFTGTNLPASTRTVLRTAFTNGRIITIDFVRTGASSGRILRAQ
ncbi:MAG: CARDB domain-containing protein [Acidobacteriota bacterium]